MIRASHLWSRAGVAPGWRSLATVVAMAGAVVGVATSLRSSTAYTASTASGGGLSTASCYFRSSVQSGTTVSSADGTTTVTIAPVDPSRAFLLFSTRHSSNRPVAIELGGSITSATTVDFVRSTNEATPATMTVEWSVVEYPCGVAVQRGSVYQTTATVDVPVNPVGSLAQAFVTWSKHPHLLDQAWDNNDPLTAELTGTSNLELRADALNVNHVIYWQVVEFTDPTMIHVQAGTTALAGGAGSTTVTVPAAVDPARTFLLVGGRSTGTGVDIGSGMVRAQLTGTNSVTLDRAATNYNVTEISWQAVELLDGSSVQSGTVHLATGTTSATVAVSAVPLARTTPFAPTQTGGGQNGGRTSYTTDDIIGVGAAALHLTSATQLAVVRDNAAADADIAWFLVSWGSS